MLGLMALLLRVFRGLQLEITQFLLVILLVVWRQRPSRLQSQMLSQQPLRPVQHRVMATDGSVTITATGGSGAGYSYAWTPSAGVTTSGNVSSGFSAGSYSLVVNDSNACTSSPITAVIEEPTTPTIVATVGNICSGGQITSAGIDFGISGGTAPYTVFQENGATDIDVTASLPLTSSSSSCSRLSMYKMLMAVCRRLRQPLLR